MTPHTLFSVAILLATQRSGTHLLKGAIDTHPQIAAPFTEVFHDGYEGDRANFFHYMLEQAKSDPTCVLPHHRMGLFSKYLGDMPTICGKPHVVVDIKYNSIHHVHTMWQTTVRPAPLFNFIRQHNVPVIHLVRRNLLKTVISNLRAGKLEQYHRLQDQPADTSKIHVKPQTVLDHLQLLQALQGAMAEAVRMCPRVLTFYYEDLLRSSTDNSGNQTVFNPEPLGQVAGLFNVEANFNLTPRTKKVTSSDLRDAVENYDELHRALAVTEFAQYFD